MHLSPISYNQNSNMKNPMSFKAYMPRVRTRYNDPTKIGFITREFLENIFGTKEAFKLESTSYLGYDYINIKRKKDDFNLCTLRGEHRTGVFDFISYEKFKDSFIIAVFDNLSNKEQNYVFKSKIFGVSRPDKGQIDEIRKTADRNEIIKKIESRRVIKSEEKFKDPFDIFSGAHSTESDCELETLLNNKPLFGKYISNGEKSVKAVSMRKYLTVPATCESKYIGTHSLGSCIGVALVGKINGKPADISIAHIDALTDRPSLYRLMPQKAYDELEITLISESGLLEKESAKSIISTILNQNKNIAVKHVSADLTNSDNFAINTKTGEVCINIPMQDFDFDTIMKESEVRVLSPLTASSHQQDVELSHSTESSH